MPLLVRSSLRHSVRVIGVDAYGAHRKMKSMIRSVRGTTKHWVYFNVFFLIRPSWRERAARPMQPDKKQASFYVPQQKGQVYDQLS